MPLGCNSSTLGQSAEPLAPARTSRRDTAYRRRYGRTVPHTAAQTRASVREDPLSRRHLLLGPLLTLGLATLAAEDCEAIGIPDILSPGLKKQLEPYLSAPAEFLKTRQRANGGEIILAPIRASRQILEAAEASLRDMNIYDPDPYIYATMLSKIRRASLDCYVRQIASNDTIESRATIMTQNYVKIADPCTFRLIAKNVTNLLPKDQQHLKTKTYKQLDELIRSFQLLDDIVDMAQEGDGTARERVPGCLQFTMANITGFENCILTSMGLEPILAT